MELWREIQMKNALKGIGVMLILVALTVDWEQIIF